MNLSFPGLLVASLLLAPAAGIAADINEAPKVAVAATRNPVEKSYRRMIEGLKLFEENHHLAPRASLRFRLLPRQTDVDMQGIVLKVVGETFASPVPLAADNSFAIERDDKALAEDASVIPNRKADSITWRAMVRTPGLAENVRRLGDLRLECIVGIKSGLISPHKSWSYQQQTRLMARRGARACDSSNLIPGGFRYLLFAERPLFSVTLRDGERTEVLALNRMYAGSAARTEEYLDQSDSRVLLDRTYSAPIADEKWSDDTLIEFGYMDEDPVAPGGAAGQVISLPGAQQGSTIDIGKSTKADVMAAMGKAYTLTFKSGYEVWLYVYANQKPESTTAESYTEFVILFGPDSTVKKMRTRESGIYQ